jgi:hypothetical protein
MLGLWLAALAIPGPVVPPAFRLDSVKACYAQLGPERKALEF